MIRFADLEDAEFEILNDVVTRFQEASESSEYFDLDLEVAGLRPELSAAIRDEVSHEESFIADTKAQLRGAPSQLGDYTVVQHVGTGGFGLVFRGHDLDAKPVAIKLPHFTSVFSKPREEVEKEANVLQKLSHKNIVRYIDSGWTGKRSVVCRHRMVEWDHRRAVDSSL